MLLQTAGSLVAIFALAGLAWWMKLGGTPRLASEDDVRRAASEVEYGFSPVAAAIDSEGASALVRDAEGRIMLIRRHGNRFAGRVLTALARATCDDHSGALNLIIDSGEARFGQTLLTIPEAETWAAAINALNVSHHA